MKKWKKILDAVPEAAFVFILGPTASGKSELALEVGKSLRVPLINADSVQVYQKVNIGTAKPSLDERKQWVHHLYDYVPPPKQLTAADYLSDVKDLFNTQPISKALFVGGSGFYLQALEKGLYPNAQVSEKVRIEVAQWLGEVGFEGLYQWIREMDPSFAKKISGNDHYRIRRSVEIMKSQNLSMTEMKEKMAKENHTVLPPHRSLKVGLTANKEVLRHRVAQRTERMLKDGWIDEVSDLVSRGLSHWAPLQSVGYKEIQACLEGRLPRETLSEQIVTSTMQLIKKQMTWFKRDQSIQWFDLNQSNKCESTIFNFLSDRL